MLTPIINKLETVHEYKNQYLYPSIEVSFHDFFEPYQSLEDVGNQLSTPFTLFVVCLIQVVWYILESLWYFLLIAPGQLLYGKLEEAQSALGHGRDDCVEVIYFIYSLVVDPIREWVAFFIRIGATINFCLNKNENINNESGVSLSNNEHSFYLKTTEDTSETSSDLNSEVTNISRLT